MPDIRDQLRRPAAGRPAWIIYAFGQTPDAELRAAADRRPGLKANDLADRADELAVMQRALELRASAPVVELLANPTYRTHVAYQRDSLPAPCADAVELILATLDALRVCALDGVMDVLEAAGRGGVQDLGDRCADLRQVMLARLDLPAED